MDTINKETANLENNGIDFDQGHIEVKIVRSRIDGKMAKLLDGLEDPAVNCVQHPNVS